MSIRRRFELSDLALGRRSRLSGEVAEIALTLTFALAHLRSRSPPLTLTYALALHSFFSLPLSPPLSLSVPFFSLPLSSCFCPFPPGFYALLPPSYNPAYLIPLVCVNHSPQSSRFFLSVFSALPCKSYLYIFLFNSRFGPFLTDQMPFKVVGYQTCGWTEPPTNILTRSERGSSFVIIS